jgi:hypothetical protein
MAVEAQDDVADPKNTDAGLCRAADVQIFLKYDRLIVSKDI